MRKDLIRACLYAGLLVAMLGGAPWPRPDWALVATGIAIIAAAIGLQRRGEALMITRGEVIAASGEGAGAASSGALRELSESVRSMAEALATRELAGVADEIERLRLARVSPVADSQEDFVRRHGFAAWASVMAPLATGERMLHRAWSAASDGHRSETRASLEASLPYLAEAAHALSVVEAAVAARTTARA